ncbi:hypothetical protein QTG56_26110 (plasmid) [Rossellomorea sp. AcN35-11]|nr:hypothetical protein [Rossellomorea aquimaris]WJV32092.1 hypothetical protein QTG56_26110 [Rossellomorea sp. AcN35-11]
MLKRITPKKNLAEEKRSALRLYINKIRAGKRILLKDNRDGFLITFFGDNIRGDEMLLDIDGEKEKVDILEFKATLSESSDIKCPICSGSRISDGYLTGSNDVKVLFRADVSVGLAEPRHEDKLVRANKCVDCDYLMLFARSLE